MTIESALGAGATHSAQIYLNGSSFCVKIWHMEKDKCGIHDKRVTINGDL